MDGAWSSYPSFDSCCEHNYKVYSSFDKTMVGLKTLPFDWKENVTCFRLCPVLKSVMLKPDTPHPQAAKPGTEFAFTLTMPPDYVCVKPIEESARLILTNGLTNKPYEKATDWAYVLEHTDKGTPHIHGVYRTASGRRISSKYFKRYWPLWDEKVKLGHGFKGGYHSPARHAESYAAYLEKEGVVVKNSVELV